ncbi:sulfotransferase domain-containing protein [Fictibacillus nanhaiensis]|nr:sulfotransferase domain-containing protein [Fictibacillus nanhaiensis]
MVVSFVYYVMNKLRTDPSYPYLSNKCSSQKDRYQAMIEGFQDGNYRRPGITEWYERFMRWSKDEGALVLKFEDLVGSNRKNECERIIKYLMPNVKLQSDILSLINVMEENIKPENSLTFRQGKVGCWRDEFDEELKRITKELCGPLLIDLGYETTNRWL